eukprot:gene9177-biopygen3335
MRGAENARRKQRSGPRGALRAEPIMIVRSERRVRVGPRARRPGRRGVVAGALPVARREYRVGAAARALVAPVVGARAVAPAVRITGIGHAPLPLPITRSSLIGARGSTDSARTCRRRAGHQIPQNPKKAWSRAAYGAETQPGSPP